MTEMLDHRVLKFPAAGRRAAIARLTKNYAPLLVQTMGNSLLDDQEHFDDEDQPLARPLGLTEMRLGATLTAAQFFLAVLMVRQKFETPAEGADDLYAFVYRAEMRVKNASRDYFGKGRLVIQGKHRQTLQAVERGYVGDILTALRIEAKADPEFDECAFWADIYRAMADADPSGVVLRAAGIVLLDYLPAFRHALAQHSTNALRTA
jgi:hypothetical protein